MRITVPLRFPQKKVWMESYSWHRYRKQGVVNTGMAKKLMKKGYMVEDANEFVKQDSPLHLDLDAIPVAAPIFPVPPKNDVSHPDWHNDTCKVFSPDTFCVEGVPQAQVFTKSVLVKKGLPDRVLEIGHSTKIDHQELLGQRVVKQAFIWDAYLNKIPKLRDLEIPQFNFNRQYGILVKRSNEILARNFIRLCETKFPSLAAQRVLTNEEEFRVSVNRHDSAVQFKLSPISHIMGKELLQPNVLSPESIEDTELPDIYPFLSSAGIDDTNIYQDTDHLAYRQDSPFPYIQTSIFSHHIAGSHTHSHPRWNNARFAGTTVLYNFATALLMARRKYGNDVQGTLPEPITTQVIHTMGRELQFSIFQLNTVDLGESSSSKVKNAFWLTPKMKLFDTCKYELGAEKFEGYNPEIFKIFMGMYAHGVSS